jgi:hypothetical protein
MGLIMTGKEAWCKLIRVPKEMILLENEPTTEEI